MATNVPVINAAAFAVRDIQSGQMLTQQNAGARIEPAGLTKLMTAYIVFQALNKGSLSLKQDLIVSDAGWHTDGSRMFLQVDKPVNTEKVIQGMLTISANDATLTLAKAIAGSEKEFVKLMNKEAKRLGLQNSHFINCTGLPVKGQFSSVNDIILLVEALKRDFPQYQSWFTQKELTYQNIVQLNRNLLLFRDDDIDGLFTGYSIEGGYNIVVSSSRYGRHIIAVVIGSDSNEARAVEANKLLLWALNDFDTIPLYRQGEKIAQIKVYQGNHSSVAVGLQQYAYITLPKASKITDLQLQLEAVEPTLAPIRSGRILGVLKIMNGHELITQKNVVALENIDNAGWFTAYWTRWKKWYHRLFNIK